VETWAPPVNFHKVRYKMKKVEVKPDFGPALENQGSVLVVTETGKPLGYLLPVEGHGVMDGTYGQVNVTLAEAGAHNAALETDAMLDLDRCKVSGAVNLYWHQATGRLTTTAGTLVGVTKVQPGPEKISFTRGGKRFVGRRRIEGAQVMFRRAS